MSVSARPASSHTAESALRSDVSSRTTSAESRGWAGRARWATASVGDNVNRAHSVADDRSSVMVGGMADGRERLQCGYILFPYRVGATGRDGPGGLPPH